MKTTKTNEISKDLVVDRELIVCQIITRAQPFRVADKLMQLSDPELVAVKLCLEGLSTMIVKDTPSYGSICDRCHLSCRFFVE